MLLLYVAGAQAADWRAVGANAKMKIEMDVSSLVRSGHAVTVWDKEEYFQPEQAQPGDFYFKTVKTLTRYGCDTRVAQPLMRVYYAEDGTEISAITPDSDGKPAYVVPDSVREWKFNYVCGGKLAAEKKSRPKPKRTALTKKKGKVSSPKEAAKPKASTVSVKPQSTAASQPAAVTRDVQTAPAVPRKPAAASPLTQSQHPQPVPARVGSTPVRRPSEPVTALETLTKSPAKKP